MIIGGYRILRTATIFVINATMNTKK